MENSINKKKTFVVLAFTSLFILCLFLINLLEEKDKERYSLHLLDFKSVVEKEIIDKNLNSEKIILFENDKYRIVKINNEISMYFEKHKKTDPQKIISLTATLVNGQIFWNCHAQGFLNDECKI